MSSVSEPEFSELVEKGPPLLGNPSRKIAGSFQLRNTSVTIANVIRRGIQTLTPSVGFRTEPYDKSDVNIQINTTPLVNDMLAHRVGMTPVCADPTQFDPSFYEFRLDVTNTEKDMKDVTASDIQVFARDVENPLEPMRHIPGLTAKFFPPDPISGDTILLTRLRPQWNDAAPKEQLKFVAKASISTGKENSRYSPVSQVSYEYTRDTDEAHVKEVLEHWLRTQKKIIMGEGLSEADRKAATDKKMLIWEDGMDEGTKGALLREFDTMEIQRCYLKDAKGDPNDFTFHVESVGVQSVQQIVESGLVACEVLVAKYATMDTEIPANVRIQQGDSRFPTMDIIFQDEGHTLGNLLETHLCEQNVENPSAELPLSYVAYKVPHPLRPEMFVRVGIETADAPDPTAQKHAAALVIARACQQLRDLFQSLRAKWVARVDPARAAAAAAAPMARGEVLEAQAKQTEGNFNFAF
jgi:DNA-directed RNA polymerase subunit L